MAIGRNSASLIFLVFGVLILLSSAVMGAGLTPANSWCEGADGNKDGMVSVVDLGAISSNWQNTSCVNPSWCSGADGNKDGAVTISDLGTLATWWQCGVNKSVPCAPVGDIECNLANSWCNGADTTHDGRIDSCNGNDGSSGSGGGQGVIELTQCGILDHADTLYILQNDIQTTGTCFTIAADNITLDGNGHKISGDGSGQGVRATSVNKISVFNLDVSYFSNGIQFLAVKDSLVKDVTSSYNTNGFAIGAGSMRNNFVRVYSNFNSNIAFGFELAASSNIVSNASFSVNSYGLTLTSASTNNTFSNIIINSSSINSILSTRGTSGANDNNTFTNVSITNNGPYAEVNFSSSIKGIQFIDMPYIGVYYFNNSGLLVKNTALGEIAFIQPISGSGNSLSSDVRVLNNLAFINESKPGLNKAANITLYNVPVFTNPVILRNGAACGANCTNYTSLNAGTVKFKVAQGGSYSIGNLSSPSMVLVQAGPIIERNIPTRVPYYRRIIARNR